MGDFAPLISNGTHLFLTVRIHARLFSPSVSKHSSHKTHHSSQRDTAECPSQGEPSTRICHAHLTNFDPIAKAWATSGSRHGPQRLL